MTHIVTVHAMIDSIEYLSVPCAHRPKIDTKLNRIIAVRRDMYRCIQFTGIPTERTLGAMVAVA